MPYLELEEEEGMTRVEKGRASTFTFKPTPGMELMKSSINPSESRLIESLERGKESKP